NRRSPRRCALPRKMANFSPQGAGGYARRDTLCEDGSARPRDANGRKPMTTRLLIHGAGGRMGRVLLRLAAESADLGVVAAVTRAPRQRVVDGVPFYAVAELAGVPEFDVLVDFSQPEAFDAALALAAGRGCAFVSGTTGLSAAQHGAMDAAAGRIPLLWAANFSLGVAALEELVERAA